MDREITLSTCSTLPPGNTACLALQICCFPRWLRIAREQGKKFVNLGLSINKGVTFFKEKWGGEPFLNHEFILYDKSRAGIIDALFNRL